MRSHFLEVGATEAEAALAKGLRLKIDPPLRPPTTASPRYPFPGDTVEVSGSRAQPFWDCDLQPFLPQLTTRTGCDGGDISAALSSSGRTKTVIGAGGCSQNSAFCLLPRLGIV